MKLKLSIIPITTISLIIFTLLTPTTSKSFNSTFQNSSNILQNITHNSLPFNEDHPCELKTAMLLSNLFNNTPIPEEYSYIKNYIRYSGTFINDYGDYFSCKSLPKTKYIIIKKIMSNILTLAMGICYFEECDKEYIEKFENHTIEFINKRRKTPIEDPQLQIIDSDEDLKTFKDKFRTGFVVSMTIVCLFLFVIVVQMFIHVCVNKKKSHFRKKENSLLPTSEINNKTSQINQTNADLSMAIEKPKKQSFVFKFLSFFDPINNFNKIFHINNDLNPSMKALKVFDGVRFIAISWVILGHSFFMTLSFFKDTQDILPFINSYKYCFIVSGFYAVDIFFFLSAFLLYLGLQKYFDKKISRLNLIIIAFINRYLRLLPLYVFVIVLLTYLIPYVGDGASWSFVGYINLSCPQHWWHNLLYINNLVKYNDPTGYCAGHTWYLANDMQFFIISIVLFFLMNNKKTLRNYVLVFLFIVTSAYQYYKVVDFNLPFNGISFTMKAKAEFFSDYYIQPWARCNPYFVGLFFCELFLETPVYKETMAKTNKKNEQNEETPSKIYKFNLFLIENNLICAILFLVGVGLMAYGVLISHATVVNEYSIYLHAFFSTFNKVLFVFGLGIILHLTFLGKLKFLKNLLSLSIFTPIARITFGIYLIHMYYQSILLGNVSATFMIHFVDYFVFAFGYFLIALGSAVVLSLVFESPVINISKYFLEGGNNNNGEKKKTQVDVKSEGDKLMEENKA